MVTRKLVKVCHIQGTSETPTTNFTDCTTFPSQRLKDEEEREEKRENKRGALLSFAQLLFQMGPAFTLVPRSFRNSKSYNLNDSTNP